MLWLDGLSQGAATFLGSLTGAGLGLIALLVGAWVYGRHNRKRDDRIRKQEARALAAALRAELGGISQTLETNAEKLDDHQLGYYNLPDLARFIRILPTLLPKLGLLDVETIGLVIDAYGMVEQHSNALIVLGGRFENMALDRRVIVMHGGSAMKVAAINRNTVATIEKATQKLDAAYLS